MKCTAAAPARRGHGCASPPAGAIRSSAASISARSVVGPSTRPSAVVASAIVRRRPRRDRRRACATARSQRVSPLRVRASIDHDESRTTSRRPPGAPLAPPRLARAHGRERQRHRDEDRDDERHRAADPLPQRLLARRRRGRAATAAATGTGSARRPELHEEQRQPPARRSPPASSHACHAAIAPKVMRGTVPGGTP